MLTRNVSFQTKLSFESKSKRDNTFEMSLKIQSNHLIPEQTIKQLETNIQNLISQNLYEYNLEKSK